MPLLRTCLVVLALTSSLAADTFSVGGLRAPVKVLRDKWGVPHIYAANQHDLFFAQGFVQARDRLYQMEVWKRTGQGRLAEVFGDSFVARDIIARKLRYRGSMEAEYTSYAPDAKAILTAFTDGINAFIARGKLPLEFELAGFKPEKWKPEDCLQRMAAYGVMSNASAELRNARLVTALGSEKTTLLLDPQPSVDLDPVPGLSYAGLGPEILRDFIGSDARIDVPAGSNNWVIAGALTDTGKPFLANDPHRIVAIPSLRYIVHLVAPGWNVIGAVEPALPGVGIGHNQSIAWGLTIFGADQQDLYVETLKADAPRTYKTPGGWQDMKVERQQIKVKGGEPVNVEVEITRHGPVIWRDATRAIALRWAGAEPGTAGYLGSLSVGRANNWREFLAAARRWKAPPENLVYADREGNIGEQSVALAPQRAWTGLLPVDGSSGAYEWKGWIDLDQLPRSFNPSSGIIATANHMMVAPDERRPIGYGWASSYRIDRVNEVLQKIAAERKITMSDMAALQNDVVSRAARDLVALLRDSKPPEDDPGVKMLLGWDGTLNVDSSAGALHEVWLRRLRKDFAADHASAEVATMLESSIPMRVLIRDIGRRSDRTDFLVRALRAAFTETQQLLGDDPAAWRWGKLHAITFRHSLNQRDATLDRGPVERPGDGDTVNATSANPRYAQVAGASFREIFDLADWDRALAINTPGQSGDPKSRHYDDLIPLWAAGRYFPLVTSRKAVERETVETIDLVPAVKRSSQRK